MIVSLALVVPQVAYADDGGYVEDLGWASLAIGAAANVPFIVYNRVKKFSVASLGGGHEITRGMAVQHSSVLNFHMGLNLIGFAAGMLHGLILSDKIDAISFSLALVMTVLTVTGIILKYSKSANIKLMSKMIHGQMILCEVMVALVWLHISSSIEG